MATLEQIRDGAKDFNKILVAVRTALNAASDFLDRLVDLADSLDELIEKVIKALQGTVKAAKRALTYLNKIAGKIGSLGGVVGKAISGAIKGIKALISRLNALMKSLPNKPSVKAKVDKVVGLIRNIQKVIWKAGSFVGKAEQVIAFILDVVRDLLLNRDFIHNRYRDWFKKAAAAHLDPLKKWAVELDGLKTFVEGHVRRIAWMIRDLTDFLVELRAKVTDFEAFKSQLDGIANAFKKWWGALEPVFEAFEELIKKAIDAVVKKDTQQAIKDAINEWQRKLDEAVKNARPTGDPAGLVLAKLEQFLFADVGAYMDRLVLWLDPLFKGVEQLKKTLRDALENKGKLLRALLRMLKDKRLIFKTLPPRIKGLIRRINDLLDLLDRVLQVGMSEEQRQEAEQKFAALADEAREVLALAPIAVDPDGPMNAGFIALSKATHRLERARQAFSYEGDLEALEAVREIVGDLVAYDEYIDEVVRTAPPIDRDPAYLDAVSELIDRTDEMLAFLPDEAYAEDPEAYGEEAEDELPEDALVALWDL